VLEYNNPDDPTDVTGAHAEYHYYTYNEDSVEVIDLAGLIDYYKGQIAEAEKNITVSKRQIESYEKQLEYVQSSIDALLAE
jgi:hypothetical protein